MHTSCNSNPVVKGCSAVNACFPRSRGQLLAAVHQADPEGNPELQKRDVTGDGIDETFCNFFVRIVLGLLGLIIPAIRANDLHVWFHGVEAKRNGWRKCTAAEAMDRAELGFPTVGAWKNPNPSKSGHVVLVVPAIGGTGMHTAQAGARNWANEPIEHAGLLSSAYAFFTHD